MIGLFSGGLATALLKILEKFLNRTKEKLEQESDMRTELRLELALKKEELAEFKSELQVVKEEVASWQTDYWQLFESFFQLRLFSRILAEKDEEAQEKIAAIVAPHELGKGESDSD